MRRLFLSAVLVLGGYGTYACSDSPEAPGVEVAMPDATPADDATPLADSSAEDALADVDAALDAEGDAKLDSSDASDDASDDASGHASNDAADDAADAGFDGSALVDANTAVDAADAAVACVKNGVSIAGCAAKSTCCSGSAWTSSRFGDKCCGPIGASCGTADDCCTWSCVNKKCSTNSYPPNSCP